MPQFVNPTYGTEEVEVRTLDSLYLSNIGLIKVDVEGSELDVMRGAEHTFKRNGWPPILYEGIYQDQRKDVEAFLGFLGYQVRELKGNWPTMFLASDHPRHSPR